MEHSQLSCPNRDAVENVTGARVVIGHGWLFHSLIVFENCVLMHA